MKWIGDVIPAHWKLMRGKSIFNLITERSQSEVKIGLENIESFTGRYVDTETMFDSEGVQVRVGDIVYGKLRPYLCKVWLASFDCNAVGDFYIFRCKDEENTKYIHLLFLSHGFTGITNASTYGSRMPRVSSSFILSLNFPLPPLAEQRAIVSYLDGKVGQIDTYIAKQTLQIELLKELKQAVIANAVTKGIDNNPNVKRKQSGVNWLGEIPEHWEVSKLRKHFIPRIQKVSDKDYEPLSVTKDGILPQLDTACKTDNGENRKLVRKGDYVVNSRSDRKGSGGISPFDGSVSLINIVIYPIDGEQEYFHYLFRSNNFVEEFYRNGRGIVADLWTTRYQEMKNIEIPVPPLPEQRAIVSYIEAQTANINKLINAYQQQVERIKEYKQRLISDAVTGKINVTGKQTQTN